MSDHTSTRNGDDSNSNAESNHGSGLSPHAPTNAIPTSGSNFSSLVINATVTAQPSTGEDGGPGIPSGVIALLLCLLLVGVVVLCVIFYLKRTGKLYKMIPFKLLTNPSRRSSLTGSDRASLHVDAHDDHLEAPSEADHNQMDELSSERRPETAMFTIDDHDMHSVDIDRTSRGSNDEYFYDEVFGKSMFEDEATNTSMRQLYLASDDAEDELDVEALVSSITGSDSKTANT